jgi:hypothetical protein
VAHDAKEKRRKDFYGRKRAADVAALCGMDHLQDVAPRALGGGYELIVGVRLEEAQGGCPIQAGGG